MLRQFSQLLEKVSQYNPRADLGRIRRAYVFAFSAHQGQKRLSGEAFITHPLAVARLVVDLNLDEDSIVAALLHDVIEDCGDKVTLKEIEKNFGLDVALIVDGLTNLKETAKRFPLHQESVENFRKLLLASIDDARVLIIRLADKLHNGRTIGALPEERQQRFAQRVFHLYSPLAEFIGLGSYKRELDDIAFQIAYPKEVHWLRRKLKTNKKEQDQRLREFIAEIKEVLKERGIKHHQVFGRTKSLWSTWQKIQRKLKQGEISKREPSAVLDQLGITILVPDLASCYAALGVIHSHWHYLPDEFDDYISNPKPNGYRSIQTTVILGNRTAEVQIKTPKMHQYNEFGPASHIAYKVAGGKSVADWSYHWVKELVSWQNGSRRRQFKVKVFEDYVYVLTPKGDILQLEKGATPVDFAYRIHTEVGHFCRGAKVNGRIVKLDYQLQNGDLVEVLVDRRCKKPRRDWLDFVKTNHARNKIRAALVE